MSAEISIPKRRVHSCTQRYGESDEIYRDRVETTAFARRLERAESAKVMVLADTLEVLGL